jgi:hypothetical protein
VRRARRVGTFARGRFPKLRLVDIVAKAPSMDEERLMKITVELERDQAETLLRFLRRVMAHDIERTLSGNGGDVARFNHASERLRVALGKTLGHHQG